MPPLELTKNLQLTLRARPGRKVKNVPGSLQKCIPGEREGGLAELVSVPEKNIFEVPNELSIKEAALAEPTAVALHAVLLAEQNIKKNLSECRILI